MNFDEKISAFAKLVESDKIDEAFKTKMDSDPNIKSCKVKIVPGRKYVKVNIGTSGAYMVDKKTEEIFGIKAYGVPHKCHYFGTLDTTESYYWGSYRAFKSYRNSFYIKSVDDVLKDRGTFTEPVKPVEKPLKVFGSNKYQELANDLSEAASEGVIKAGDVSDSGTCNCDSIFVKLPNFNENKTLDAIEKAGLSGYKTKRFYTTGFLISPPNTGQARKREVAAETMYQALKAKDYDVSQWHQMD